MELDEHAGHLLLLMAPSGSGKKNLVDSVLATHRDIYFAKTFTTRSIRAGVEENPLYSFISREIFEIMIEKGEFIEWAEYGGNLYGTPKSEVIPPITNGKVVFKEIELQGVHQMRNIVPKENLTVVYVDAGSWHTLQRRIVGRAAISDEELAARKKRYEEESKSKSEADVIINNRDGQLPAAKAHMEKLVHELVDEVQSK